MKLWVKGDSLSGYDLNVYSGKEDGQADGNVGERVIRKLTSWIRNTDVVLYFDRH